MAAAALPTETKTSETIYSASLFKCNRRDQRLIEGACCSFCPTVTGLDLRFTALRAMRSPVTRTKTLWDECEMTPLSESA